MAEPQETPEATGKSPPWLSPVTLTNFVETHRRTLPSRIDRSLMKSVAGGDQPRILAALQFLSLTDAGGKPTPLFERMRAAEADELKAIWDEIVRKAYAPMFSGIDLSSATQQHVDEQFKASFGVSGDTARKSIAFFLALARVAGVELSPYVKQTRQRPPRPLGTRRPTGPRRGKREEGASSGVHEPDQDDQPGKLLHPAVQAWIDEMPANGEAWDRSDFESWLMIFKASVERAYKIGSA